MINKWEEPLEYVSSPHAMGSEAKPQKVMLFKQLMIMVIKKLTHDGIYILHSPSRNGRAL